MKRQNNLLLYCLSVMLCVSHYAGAEEALRAQEAARQTLVEAPEIRKRLEVPVSIDMRDVELKIVLDYLSETSGVNIIPSTEVAQREEKVTIHLKDMPLRSALKYILMNRGITYRVEKNAVWVATIDDLNEEPIETRVYFLNQSAGLFTKFSGPGVGAAGEFGHAGSVEEVRTIKDILEEAVSFDKDSKVTLDERSGALIVSNTPENLKIIEEILYNLDVTPMQVLIEARFVEVTVTDTTETGLETQLNEALGLKQRDSGATSTNKEGNITQIASGSGIDFLSFTRATEGLNLTYKGILSYPQFQFVLHALAESSKAKTLSCPRVTTLNNQMAAIKVVDEFVYPSRYEVSFSKADNKFVNMPQDFVTRDVGILLRVTPNIGSDRKTITLTLLPEVSEDSGSRFSYSGEISLPKFTSRNLSTTVVVNDGETIVIGGLIRDSTTKALTKIPLLADIPLLGLAFQRKSDSIERKNLIIFVTARLMSPSGALTAVKNETH